MSAFEMGGIDYYTASMALKALEYDPFKVSENTIHLYLKCGVIVERTVSARAKTVLFLYSILSN